MVGERKARGPRRLEVKAMASWHWGYVLGVSLLEWSKVLMRTGNCFES